MLKKFNLDHYRFFAALLVVAIHIYPLTSLNEEVDYLFSRVFCRIAVPFFLMITGYFVLPKAKENPRYLQEFIKKIGKIYILSIFLYLPLNLYNHSFQNASLFKIISDVLINGTFYHLWYFPALMLGICITYVVVKIENKKVKSCLFVLLYLIGLLGDSYYGLIKEIPLLKEFFSFLFTWVDYTRNGFFYVPIFLGIGYLWSEKKENLNKKWLFFLFLFLMLGEGMVLHYFSIPKHTSMYIFLLPVSYYLFGILLRKNKGNNLKVRNLATGIYILHPLCIVGVRLFAKVFYVEKIFVKNSMIHYLAVLFLTIFLVILGEKIKEFYRRKK